MTVSDSQVKRPGPPSWLFRRWQNPAHPLYMAVAFQVVLFFLIVVLDYRYAAGGFLGGTIGCIVASLRLQKSDRAP